MTVVIDSVEKIENQLLRGRARAVANMGGLWAAWRLTVDERPTELLAVGASLNLAQGDLLLAGGTLGAEGPEAAARRLLGARCAPEVDAARSEVWCGIFLQMVPHGSASNAATSTDAALHELEQRGLLNAMHRVVTGQ